MANKATKIWRRFIKLLSMLMVLVLPLLFIPVANALEEESHTVGGIETQEQDESGEIALSEDEPASEAEQPPEAESQPKPPQVSAAPQSSEPEQASEAQAPQEPEPEPEQAEEQNKVSGPSYTSETVSANFVTEPPKALGNVNINEYFNIVAGNDNTIGSGVYSGQDNVAIITQSTYEQKGAMWAKEKLDLNYAFVFEIALYLGRDANQKQGQTPVFRLADGMTFTMHNDDYTERVVNGETGYFGENAIAPSTKGQDLAVYSTGEHAGSYLRNALTIEFDTFSNNNYDPFYKSDQKDSQHIAMLRPADSMTAASHSEFTDPAYFRLHDGWYRFYATWEPYYEEGKLYGALTYTFSDYVAPATGRYYYYTSPKYSATTYTTQTAHIDVADVFGAASLDEGVWWGFTGSTGSFTSLQAAALINMPEQTVMKRVSYEGTDLHGGTVPPGETVDFDIQVTWTRGASANVGNTHLLFVDELDDMLAYVDGSASISYQIGGEGFTIPVDPIIDQENEGVLLFQFDSVQNLIEEGDHARLRFSASVSPLAGGKTVYNSAKITNRATGTEMVTNTVAFSVDGTVTANRVYQGDTAVSGTVAARSWIQIIWPGGREGGWVRTTGSGAGTFSHAKPADIELKAGDEITLRVAGGTTTVGAVYSESTLTVQALRVTAEKLANVQPDETGHTAVAPGEAFSYLLRSKAHPGNASAGVNRPGTAVTAQITDILPEHIEYVASRTAGGQVLHPEIVTDEQGRTVLVWEGLTVPSYASGGALEIIVDVRAAVGVQGSVEQINYMAASTLPGNSYYTSSDTAAVTIEGAQGHTLTVLYKSLDGDDSALHLVLAEAGIENGKVVLENTEEFSWADDRVNPGYLSALEAVYYTAEGGEKNGLDTGLTLERDTEIQVFYGSTLLQISMPGRVFFYALAQDGGEVHSPVHSITNHSSLPVQVELERLDTEGRVEGVEIDTDGIVFVNDADAAVQQGGNRAMHLNVRVGVDGINQTLPAAGKGFAPNTQLALTIARLDGLDWKTDYSAAQDTGKTTARFTIGGRYVSDGGVYPSDAYRPKVGFTFRITPLRYSDTE